VEVEQARVTYYAATLGAVDASAKSLTLQVQGGDEVTITGKVIVDASPTLDLARAFGCEYRIGKDETVYGPGLAPAPPTSANNYITAPQAMAGLPTFRIVGSVPSMWSTTTGKLPNGLCEFNEAVSDYRVAQDVFDWVFRPDLRPAISRPGQGLVDQQALSGYAPGLLLPLAILPGRGDHRQRTRPLHRRRGGEAGGAAGCQVVLFEVRPARPLGEHEQRHGCGLGALEGYDAGRVRLAARH